MYLEADPYVAMFTLNDLNPDTVVQTIHNLWDLADMLLMPEDEVHFHFELTDNDIFSGPKKTVSSTFIARVPSLADLYETAENTESDFMEEITTGTENFQELKELFEALELEALKTKDLDWDQQQSVKNAIEKTKEQFANMKKWLKPLSPSPNRQKNMIFFHPTS